MYSKPYHYPPSLAHYGGTPGLRSAYLRLSVRLWRDSILVTTSRDLACGSFAVRHMAHFVSARDRYQIWARPMNYTQGDCSIFRKLHCSLSHHVLCLQGDSSIQLSKSIQIATLQDIVDTSTLIGFGTSMTSPLLQVQASDRTARRTSTAATGIVLRLASWETSIYPL